MRYVALFSLLCGSSGLLLAADAPPRSLDPKLTITLFAEHPQLVTPTGMDVDERGHVWAIESNTHFPPKDYKGHPSDRLLVLHDADGDGRAEQPRVFLDGLKHTMSVAVRPEWMPPIALDPKTAPAQRQVFVATRREILLLEDVDGDDHCDRQTRLVWLDTKGDYPHNGLAGFAFDALGSMFFGFGENLGEPYAIHSRGAENEPLKGGGEGGNIYRMRPDGTQMEFWATGFWNPHASCVDGFGRLFTVDNDPDSRPPCRLLHVIRGGDYGYKFRNGRKGLHPFTAWNGELPGTLPMVAGTGEAPSGILAYEHDAFPEDYLGNLIVTSWGDHRIDRFRLKDKGASVESVTEPFIVGGEEFRPVGIALAPDGALYCTDWVKRDYQLHGHGRVWRIAPGKRPTPQAIREVADKESEFPTSKRRASARALTNNATDRQVLATRILDRDLSSRVRLEALWALASSDEAAKDKPFGRRPETIRAICQNFVDPVHYEVIALAERPQIGFPDHQEFHSDTISFAFALAHSDADPGKSRLQMRSMILGAPQLVRQKSSDWRSAATFYGFGLATDDRFLASTAIDVLARTGYQPEEDTFEDAGLALRDAVNRAILARRRNPQDLPYLRRLLDHPAPIVRQMAVQWAGEEKIVDLRETVAGQFKAEPMTADLFLATLAALEMLDGKSPQDFDKTPPGKYVAPLLRNPMSSDAVKIQALRLIGPPGEVVPTDTLATWADSSDANLAGEALRTLALSTDPAAVSVLLRTMDDTTRPLDIRYEAILGLTPHVQTSPPIREAVRQRVENVENLEELVELARALRNLKEDDAVRRTLEAEVHRYEFPTNAMEERLHEAFAFALDREPHSTPGTPKRSRPPEEWTKLLTAEETKPGGDAERGRRVFFSSKGANCAKCHTVDGRGGQIGPNLSMIGASSSREKLIESILEPSKEVSPQFTSWSMVSIHGQVFTGMLVHENEGKTVLGDSTGKLIEVKTAEVEERVPLKTSVMPEKLADLMTRQDFLDLLAYLSSRR